MRMQILIQGCVGGHLKKQMMPIQWVCRVHVRTKSTRTAARRGLSGAEHGESSVLTAFYTNAPV